MYVYQLNPVRSFTIFQDHINGKAWGCVFAEGEAIRICRLLNEEYEINKDAGKPELINEILKLRQINKILLHSCHCFKMHLMDNWTILKSSQYLFQVEEAIKKAEKS